MKSIRTKILIVVISGLFVMTAVIAGISFFTTHDLMHRDADRILQETCGKEAAYINEVLRNISKSTDIMEHFATKELRNLDMLRNEVSRRLYLNEMESTFKKIATNTKGLDAFYLRLNPDYAGPVSGFFNAISDDKVITSLSVTDLSLYSPEDTEHVGWYYQAVNAGDGVWMQPYNNLNTGELLISYVAPFYCEGELAGILGMDLDFEYLVSQVKSIPIYKDGQARLISADGNTDYSAITSDASPHESANPHARAIQPLDNGMQLELVVDYRDIQSDVFPLLTSILVAFVLVLMAFIAYTVFFTRRITAPLKKLTLAVQNLQVGSGEADLDIRSDDEIGTLAKAFRSTYDQLREYTSYINSLAYRDSLTGIKNRTSYTEAVLEMDKRICCGSPLFGVLVADINNLKQSNDCYGHDIGNELVIHTARILSETFRSSPVFRIGGDEFVVILEGKDFDNYRSLIQRMDEACIRDYISVGDEQISLSVARGVAVFNPQIDKVFADVFNNADHSMYLHKQSVKSNA